MLLYGLNGSPPRPAVYAFPVSGNDKMQIGEESLEIDYEILVMRDKQAVGFLHVYDAVAEAW